MSCKLCAHIHDITDLSTPYVIRTCNECGRKMCLREPGDNGHGIKVEKGDEFKIPNGWLQIAANPLKGSGQFSKYGLGWFAKLIFVEKIQSENDVDSFIEETKETCNKILRESEILNGLSPDKEEDAEEIIKLVESNQSTSEWWAFLAGTFNAIVSDALSENDARKAAWAMRATERCRAMIVFKNHLEEVVWMGHSARRIIDVIRKWNANKDNSKEDYWQQLFNENPYVLSQIFSVPVIFLRDNAYVGGMTVNRQDAKFVDYLYANESSHDAVLVEIKTPVAKLLGGKYRKGVYKPSAELSGSIVQALDYRRELSKNIKGLVESTEHNLEIFSPRCIIVAGNALCELDTDIKRKSFELYRTSLKDVEIITFDELFKKAETLASLFNLVWKSK